MNFIYPGFLFALSAISIPIIIHLFNFRRFKKVFFTNVRFLQEIKQDTKSRSHLKHLLILIARILAVSFLVLAFAQPYRASKNIAALKERNKISVYIDNSFSMDAVGKNGSLIEEAKKKAREIARHYQPSDQFQLLTNDFEARHQRLVNREEMLNLIDDVQPSSSVRRLSEVILRQHAALNSNGADNNSARLLFEISDFQKSTADIDELKNDSATDISLVALASQKVNNLYIDSCWLSSPVVQLNAANELTVIIKNNSTSAAENIPVKLLINGTQRALASVNIPEYGSIETKLNFSINEPGWQSAVISITDYPVTFDDNYFFSFDVRNNLHVLAINGTAPSHYLNALFSNDSLFNYKNASENQVDYSSLGSNQLIVLNGIKSISTGLAQELKKFADKGGSLVVFPAGDMDISTYQSFLQSCGTNYYSSLNTNKDKVNKLTNEHLLFKDVFETKRGGLPENLDLPVAEKYFPITKSTRSKEEVLMQMNGGSAFFTSTGVGRGKIYLSAVPLDETFSNFVKHALFVPVMLRIALISGRTVQHSYVIGRETEIEFSDTTLSGDNVFHLINKKENFDIIPESKMADGKTFIAVHDQLKKAGNYDLVANNKTDAAFAFNYDRKESDLRAYTNDELNSEIEKAKLQHISTLNPESKDLSYTLSREKEGVRLWKWCVLLALLFLACEVALIKFMKG